MFLIDTNVASEMRRPAPDSNVLRWFESRQREALFLSVLSITEMEHGAAAHVDPVQRHNIQRWLRDTLPLWFPGRILQVTQEIAQTAGIQIGTRQRSGRPLSLADALISATAIHHNLVLVTRNTKDFVELPLDVFDPWTSDLTFGEKHS